MSNTASTPTPATVATPASVVPATTTLVASRVDAPKRVGGQDRGVATTDAAGTTHIADGVVAKIAGIAARQVPGVHAIGGGASRAVGALRSVVGQQDHGQGVKVEVGETQVAADISIVVEYPQPVKQVASQVREAVAEAITQLVGLQVVEINIEVSDIYIAGEDDSQDSETDSRVQ